MAELKLTLFSFAHASILDRPNSVSFTCLERVLCERRAGGSLCAGIETPMVRTCNDAQLSAKSKCVNGCGFL